MHGVTKSGVRLFFILALVSLLSGGCAAKRAANVNEARAVRDLGEAYLIQGSFSRALQEFLKAEQLNPRDPYLHNNIGLTYLALDRPESAVLSFQKAVDLRSDYAPARNNLATAYMALGRWDDAIDVLKLLSEDLLYATPHYALSNLGWSYYNLGNYDTALRYYNRALRHESRHPPALRGQAMTFSAMGRMHEALRSADRLTSEIPMSAAAWMLKGEILEKMNQREEAKKAYEEALRTADEDSEIKDDAEFALRRLR
ncbi:Tfp pilus assembly protein PilF [Desulfobotulus alkaliphilus]|uniref:Tfp pilus assembly protein PilF n=1 Tax=Desulfobotulus alkaliphilus TaxID=622671 RepID=A0A562RAG5_9BACT|nr:tetratricopeptide repeat protein [Desulfobotulus alkaliphilus]TWI66057.1 Tfp pilus assembly protein PilF [Desulfobotulus alkaliphilus]